MRYEGTSFIKPPRAEHAIRPDLLPFYEQKKGWKAQVKLNGTYSEIVIPPKGDLVAWTRHGTPHKAWKWTEESRAAFERWRDPCGTIVVCAELLHSKVSGLRDIHFAHDILVYRGEILRGKSYGERYTLLNMLPQPDEVKLHILPLIEQDFYEEFMALDKPEQEGLVLKNLHMKIWDFTSQGWTKKCRRETKTLSC